MPKVNQEAIRATKAKAYLAALAASPEGVGVRHCLTEPLAGLEPGTWLFGLLRVENGRISVDFTGTSKPPKK